MVLEKTLESPLDFKDIHPVHPKGDQSWGFIGRTDAKAETPILWPPHAKSWLIGKNPDAGRDWGQEEKGPTEDEMAGWHHLLDGLEFDWTPGVGDRQGGLACCDSWGRKELDTTEQLNWTELNWSLTRILVSTLSLFIASLSKPSYSVDATVVLVCLIVFLFNHWQAQRKTTSSFGVGRPVCYLVAQVLRARFINCALGQNWLPLSFHGLDCLFNSVALYILYYKSSPHFIWKECHRIEWIGPFLSPNDSKQYLPSLRLSLQMCKEDWIGICSLIQFLHSTTRWFLHFKGEHGSNIDQMPWIARHFLFFLFLWLSGGRRKGIQSHCQFLNRSYATLEEFCKLNLLLIVAELWFIFELSKDAVWFIQRVQVRKNSFGSKASC